MFNACMVVFFFFFKQKTAYEMRISDWSSDVCSSDLGISPEMAVRLEKAFGSSAELWVRLQSAYDLAQVRKRRSEEHTSELQSLMRISYAVFCLKKKKKQETYK